MTGRAAATGPARTARQEWAAMWPLPLVSMLGYVGGAAFAYSSGVFMKELTREFGWSRTQFSTAFTIHSVLALVMAPVVGRLVDRFGPRRMALIAAGLAGTNPVGPKRT